MDTLVNIDVKKKQTNTKTAITLESFNKYEPGKQKFYIPSLTPTKPKSTKFNDAGDITGNILNKDVGSLNIQPPEVGSCITLEVPKDVTRWFEVKYIPAGTGFLVSFDNGDITKARIIGRDFVEEQGSYNNPLIDGNNIWSGDRM